MSQTILNVIYVVISLLQKDLNIHKGSKHKHIVNINVEQNRHDNIHLQNQVPCI